MKKKRNREMNAYRKLLIAISLIIIITLGFSFYGIAQDGLDEFPIVILETNQGRIEIMLYPDIAPKACQNFIGLAKQGYYDGLIFHRVIKGFMIQGGDPTGTGRGGESIWGGKFEDEFSPDFQFDRPGILAMANAGPNTNGSQFFITTVPTPWLNRKHTIFGEVIVGFDTVQQVENTPVDAGHKPLQPQKIIKAYLLNQ